MSISPELDPHTRTKVLIWFQGQETTDSQGKNTKSCLSKPPYGY